MSSKDKANDIVGDYNLELDKLEGGGFDFLFSWHIANSAARRQNNYIVLLKTDFYQRSVEGFHIVDAAFERRNVVVIINPNQQRQLARLGRLSQTDN